MKKEVPTYTVYVTQYALTKGIQEKEVWLCGNDVQCSDVNQCVMVNVVLGSFSNEFYHKPHWHVTKEDAIKQANAMKARKVQSLNKQIAKINALKFD